jgi:hypothetical protein
MQCIGCDNYIIGRNDQKKLVTWIHLREPIKNVVLTNKINHFINWSNQPKIFGYINQLLLVEMTN